MLLNTKCNGKSFLLNFLDVNWLKKCVTERYGIMVRKKFRTVLLRTVFFRGTKLRYGMFLEEYSTENNSVPYRSNSMLLSNAAPMNIAAMGSRWRHFVQFDWLGNQIPDLSHR